MRIVRKLLKGVCTPLVLLVASLLGFVVGPVMFVSSCWKFLWGR